MRIVCLDLEGVLVPEIWITFSEATGIKELRRTTRDEPDYEKLMGFRISILKERGLTLKDIQNVIGNMDVLPGAKEFVDELRQRTQFVILSDTFEEFARPLMAKLGYPTLFCNSLAVDTNGMINGFHLRQKEGKMHVVAAFKRLNMSVFAAGDSFNDLAMLREAHDSCLFRPPEAIKKSFPNIKTTETFEELLAQIDRFLAK